MTLHHASFGWLKVFLIIMAAILLIAVAGYAAYRFMVQPAVDDGVVDSTPSDDSAGGEDEDTPADTTPEPEPEPNPSLLDSDGDGLTNADELAAGTLSNNSDTDDDGLGDREEIKVYDTDPNEEDTDGDGYTDGDEVENGYNPNGDGKLLNVPTN